jgi:hypothetical protein
VDRLAFPGTDQLLLFRVETRDGTLPPDSKAPREKYPRVARVRELRPGGEARLVAEVPDFDWHVFDAYPTAEGRFVVVDGTSGRRRGKLTRSLNLYELTTGRRVWSVPLQRDVISSANLRLDASGKALAFRPSSQVNPFTVLRIPSGAFVTQLGEDLDLLGPVNEPAFRWLGISSRNVPGEEHVQVGLFESDRNEPLLRLFLFTPWSVGPGRTMSGTTKGFSRDGHFVVWGNTDGTVTVLDLRKVQGALSRYDLGWQ